MQVELQDPTCILLFDQSRSVTGMDGESLDVAQNLGELALEMQKQSDTEATLRAMVTGAVAIVPGARWAGISLVDGKSVHSRVPSDPLVAKLDALQSETGEGPCLSALMEHHTVLIDDLAAEDRWPRFCDAALAAGVRSLLSFQLFVIGKNLGALNLYAGEPGVYSEDSVIVGEIVAHHASVALAGAAAEDQFGAALRTRDIIGQAKGIIMERLGVDAPAAFALLTRLSQDSNIKLVEVAKRLIATVEKST